MVSPPLGQAKGGKKQGSLSWVSTAGLQRALKKKSAVEVLSRSQETRPRARGGGQARAAAAAVFGLRPILQARVKFTRPAPSAAARRGQAGMGTPRERRRGLRRRGLRAGFSPKPSAAALPSERARLRACRRRRRRGSFSPLLLCEGKGASPFHGLRPLRAPLRVFRAAATALGKMAVLSLVSE